MSIENPVFRGGAITGKTPPVPSPMHEGRTGWWIKIVLALGVICLAAPGLGLATEIEWGDFQTISHNPSTNGSVTTADGGFSFDVEFTSWTSNIDNFDIVPYGATATSNGLYTWDGPAYLLHGGTGGSAFDVTFRNIASHDGSLYFTAGALYGSNPLSIAAFDDTGGVVDLSGTSLVGTFFDSDGGAATWDSGSFSTPGGGASGRFGLIDLSGLGINEIRLTYTTNTSDGFAVDLGANEQATVPIPGTAVLLLTGLLGVRRSIGRTVSGNPVR